MLKLEAAPLLLVASAGATEKSNAASTYLQSLKTNITRRTQSRIVSIF